MINVSREFKKNIEADKRDFLVWIDMTLRDGATFHLENSHLWENSLKIDEGVTASGKFTIGSCSINKLTFTLNNIYDDFSTYDFDGAEVVVYLGLELSGTTEKIRKGMFVVDEPQYDGSTITLECLDYMAKLDKDYSGVKTSYPATLGIIVKDICDYCGVALGMPEFDSYTYEIAGRPEDDALTCRQVLGYCAQIACCFGRFDTNGRLRLEWFETSIFEKNDNLDGGFFDDGMPQYITGDVADGGNFDDYSSGKSIDGGSFDDLALFHHLYSMSSFSSSTDDVVITGITVTEEFTETERDKKNSVTVGSPGYVLDISGNKFIQKGAAEIIANYLGNKLIGVKFRPITAQVLSDPTVEAGDLAYVTDRKQNTYNCLVTNLSFNLGGFMSVSCDAETPSKNSAKQYSELTKAIVEIRKEARKQSSSLATVMAQSFGVFKTEEAQEDGSIIYYMHDKPTLAESKHLWKFTADGFAVSPDGGATWVAGMDANGNATVNILSAIGINCDWIHSGTLTLGGYNNQNGRFIMQDANGNEIGRWDKDGVYATGRYVCHEIGNEYDLIIEKGRIRLENQRTGDVAVWFEMTKDPSIGNVFNLRCGSATIQLYKEGLYMNGNRIAFNGSVGKSGRAEMSDGTYFDFKNGMLVSGHALNGDF